MELFRENFDEVINYTYLYSNFEGLISCVILVISTGLRSSVADPERFDADPDPAFQANAHPAPDTTFF